MSKGKIHTALLNASVTFSFPSFARYDEGDPRNGFLTEHAQTCGVPLDGKGQIVNVYPYEDGAGIQYDVLCDGKLMQGVNASWVSVIVNLDGSPCIERTKTQGVETMTAHDTMTHTKASAMKLSADDLMDAFCENTEEGYRQEAQNECMSTEEGRDKLDALRDEGCVLAWEVRVRLASVRRSR